MHGSRIKRISSDQARCEAHRPKSLARGYLCFHVGQPSLLFEEEAAKAVFVAAHSLHLSIEHHVQVEFVALQGLADFVPREDFVGLWGRVIRVQSQHWPDVVGRFVLLNQKVGPFLLKRRQLSPFLNVPLAPLSLQMLRLGGVQAQILVKGDASIFHEPIFPLGVAPIVLYLLKLAPEGAQLFKLSADPGASLFYFKFLLSEQRGLLVDPVLDPL